MPDNMPPIDTNVKIPRGVLASSAKSDAIHAAAYQTTPEAGAEAQSGAEAAPPQPTNPSPPPPAPAPAQAAPQPQQQPAQRQPPPETADDWKQRYQSLKGRHDTLTGTVANQNARLASLESMLATMQAAPKPAPAQPQPSRPASKRVTDKDVTEFGTDLLDVVRRAALDAVEPEIERRVADVRTSVQSDLKRVNGKLGEVEKDTAISAHQRLLTALDQAIPNWRTVNRHPKFHEWLLLTDPFSGVIRKRLLDDAVKRGDVQRSASFYVAFLAEQGVSAPTNGNGSRPPPGNGNGAAKVDLASLAAPGRPAASGSPQQTPENKPIITRAQISAFYTNKQKGMYPPEEAAAHEKLIFEATKDGRVR